MAATDIVQTHDEKSVGIDRFARADTLIPPAGFAIVLVIPRGVVVARQRVADQHGIAALLVEYAVGLVNQLVVGQGAATGQLSGSVKFADWGVTSPRESGLIDSG